MKQVKIKDNQYKTKDDFFEVKSVVNILNDIISSIKNLTFFKLGIVFLLSVFQIIVIQKFFGPDKRVSSVKGAFSDGL